MRGLTILALCTALAGTATAQDIMPVGNDKAATGDTGDGAIPADGFATVGAGTISRLGTLKPSTTIKTAR